MAVTFIQNISLLFAILIAPSILLLAIWHRKSTGKAVFVWHKPEMVLLTIIFFIISLILGIVGVSCLFLHWGYLESSQFPAITSENFMTLGLSCAMLLTGFSMTYLALRKVLVQIILDRGVVVNKNVFSAPNSLDIIGWDQIVDYYVTPDYPNVFFTFIIKRDELKFERHSIKVPVYLKDDFQSYLDNEIYSAQTIRSNSEISNHFYSSEN